MPDQLVKEALDLALRDVVSEHFKGFTAQVDSDATPEQHKAVLQSHFLKGLRNTLLAYDLATKSLSDIIEAP